MIASHSLFNSSHIIITLLTQGLCQAIDNITIQSCGQTLVDIWLTHLKTMCRHSINTKIELLTLIAIWSPVATVIYVHVREFEVCSLGS